jgi:hypothetical protein
MIEAAFQELLQGSPYPIATVGARVFKLLAIQGATPPYIVISRISHDPLHTQSGPPAVRRTDLQFSVWSMSQSEGAAIEDELRALLDGYRGEIGGYRIEATLLKNGRYFYEDASKKHHFATDYRVQYRAVA